MKKQKPNVVLFISDQQRWDTLHCGGNEAIETPHLDFLANDGTRFERAFCTSPLCMPARGSLMTGLYPHSHGMVANGLNSLPDAESLRPDAAKLCLKPDQKTLGSYLSELGFSCGYAGKWHLGTKGKRPGFPDFTVKCHRNDLDDPADSHLVRLAAKADLQLDRKLVGIQPKPEAFDAMTRVGEAALPLSQFPAVFMAVRSTEYIYRMAREERPFLLVYSTDAPHPPPPYCPSRSFPTTET